MALTKCIVLAFCAISGFALHTTLDRSTICGKEKAPYESFNPHFPDTCTVFCVPSGTCEGKAQLGQLKQYGITGPGTCQKKGFTEIAELGVLGQQVNDSLKFLTGPCAGMTMTKYKYAEKNVAATQTSKYCGKEKFPYESFNLQFPDTCTVFCVPSGACEGKAQQGQLKQYGITGPGTCKKKGFTELAELGVLGTQVNDSLKLLIGPCAGMTMTKYRYPEKVPGDLEQKSISSSFCGKEKSPYESFNFQFPDFCTVYCVPSGACEGHAQRGDLKQYGITGPGTCQKKGFTELAELGILGKEVNDSLKFLTGACAGMTMTKYKYPEKALS